MEETDGQIHHFLTPVATESASMLCDPSPPRLSEFDRQVYRAVVPPDHYLRKALKAVPWDDYHEILAPYYDPDLGRPVLHPVEQHRFVLHILDYPSQNLSQLTTILSP